MPDTESIKQEIDTSKNGIIEIQEMEEFLKSEENIKKLGEAMESNSSPELIKEMKNALKNLCGEIIKKQNVNDISLNQYKILSFYMRRGKEDQNEQTYKKVGLFISKLYKNYQKEIKKYNEGKGEKPNNVVAQFFEQERQEQIDKLNKLAEQRMKEIEDEMDPLKQQQKKEEERLNKLLEKRENDKKEIEELIQKDGKLSEEEKQKLLYFRDYFYKEGHILYRSNEINGEISDNLTNELGGKGLYSFGIVGYDKIASQIDKKLNSGLFNSINNIINEGKLPKNKDGLSSLNGWIIKFGRNNPEEYEKIEGILTKEVEEIINKKFKNETKDSDTLTTKEIGALQIRTNIKYEENLEITCDRGKSPFGNNKNQELTNLYIYRIQLINRESKKYGDIENISNLDNLLNDINDKNKRNEIFKDFLENFYLPFKKDPYGPVIEDMVMKTLKKEGNGGPFKEILICLVNKYIIEKNGIENLEIPQEWKDALPEGIELNTYSEYFNRFLNAQEKDLAKLRKTAEKIEKKRIEEMKRQELMKDANEKIKKLQKATEELTELQKKFSESNFASYEMKMDAKDKLKNMLNLAYSLPIIKNLEGYNIQAIKESCIDFIPKFFNEDEIKSFFGENIFNEYRKIYDKKLQEYTQLNRDIDMVSQIESNRNDTWSIRYNGAAGGSVLASLPELKKRVEYQKNYKERKGRYDCELCKVSPSEYWNGYEALFYALAKAPLYSNGSGNQYPTGIYIQIPGCHVYDKEEMHPYYDYGRYADGISVNLREIYGPDFMSILDLIEKAHSGKIKLYFDESIGKPLSLRNFAEITQIGGGYKLDYKRSSPKKEKTITQDFINKVKGSRDEALSSLVNNADFKENMERLQYFSDGLGDIANAWKRFESNDLSDAERGYILRHTKEMLDRKNAIKNSGAINGILEQIKQFSKAKDSGITSETDRKIKNLEKQLIKLKNLIEGNELDENLKILCDESIFYSDDTFRKRAAHRLDHNLIPTICAVAGAVAAIALAPETGGASLGLLYMAGLATAGGIAGSRVGTGINNLRLYADQKINEDKYTLNFGSGPIKTYKSLDKYGTLEYFLDALKNTKDGNFEEAIGNVGDFILETGLQRAEGTITTAALMGAGMVIGKGFSRFADTHQNNLLVKICEKIPFSKVKPPKDPYAQDLCNSIGNNIRSGKNIWSDFYDKFRKEFVEETREEFIEQGSENIDPRLGMVVTIRHSLSREGNTQIYQNTKTTIDNVGRGPNNTIDITLSYDGNIDTNFESLQKHLEGLEYKFNEETKTFTKTNETNPEFENVIKLVPSKQPFETRSLVSNLSPYGITMNQSDGKIYYSDINSIMDLKDEYLRTNKGVVNINQEDGTVTIINGETTIHLEKNPTGDPNNGNGNQLEMGENPANSDPTNPIETDLLQNNYEIETGPEIEQISQILGPRFHEERRQGRLQTNGTYEPRIEKTTDQTRISQHNGETEVDTANTPFEELPNNWKQENLEAARVAVGLVYNKVKNGENITPEMIEEMAEIVHNKRLERNGTEGSFENQRVAYEQLSEEEKAKDRKQILQAIEIVGQGDSDYFGGKSQKIFDGDTGDAELNSKFSDRILSEIDEQNKSTKLEELRKEISEQYKQATGEELELNEEQLLSILDAHEQDGKLGELSIGELRVKVKILSEAITDPKVRRFLLEAGFCGNSENENNAINQELEKEQYTVGEILQLLNIDISNHNKILLIFGNNGLINSDINHILEGRRIKNHIKERQRREKLRGKYGDELQNIPQQTHYNDLIGYLFNNCAPSTALDIIINTYKNPELSTITERKEKVKILNEIGVTTPEILLKRRTFILNGDIKIFNMFKNMGIVNVDELLKLQDLMEISYKRVNECLTILNEVGIKKANEIAKLKKFIISSKNVKELYIIGYITKILNFENVEPLLKQTAIFRPTLTEIRSYTEFLLKNGMSKEDVIKLQTYIDLYDKIDFSEAETYVKDYLIVFEKISELNYTRERKYKIRRHVLGLDSGRILTGEQALNYIEILKIFDDSISNDIQRIKDELADEILESENPKKAAESILNIFERNNLPLTGKIYKVFEILYPEGKFEKTLQEHGSPVLHQYLQEGKDVYGLIYRDLMNIAIKSGDRSLKDYLEVFKGSENILRKFENLIQEQGFNPNDEQCLKGLSANEKEQIFYLFKKTSTLYSRYFGKELNEGDLNEGELNISDTQLVKFYNEIKKGFNLRDGKSIYDRLQTLLYINGLKYHSVEEVLQEMELSKKQAHERGLNLVNESEGGKIKFPEHAFLKGVKEDAFHQIINRGITSREYLGGGDNGKAAGSDLTPFDIDGWFTSSFKSEEGYGNINLVINADKECIYNSREEGTDQDTRGKYELFSTGVLGEDHYGIRTGIPMTEVDYIIYTGNFNGDEFQNICYEITKNGYYIPITDAEGNIKFTPEMYHLMRQGFNYMDEYSGFDVTDNNGTYTVMEQDTQINKGKDNTELQSLINENSPENPKYKRTAEENNRLAKASIERIKTILTEKCGITFNSQYDPSITGAEIHDSGSTGRGTDIPTKDVDLDFTLLIDPKDYENIDEIVKIIHKEIGTKERHKDEGARYNKGETIGYQIKSEENNLGAELGRDNIPLDLLILKKSQVIDYSSSDAMKERLNIISNNPNTGIEDLNWTKTNVIIMKKLLKAMGCYKKTEGGMSGIGVENRILQNHGSFIEALESFEQVAYGGKYEEGKTPIPLEEFKKLYPIYDAGQNYKDGCNDNFVDKLNDNGYNGTLSIIQTYRTEGIEGIRKLIKQYEDKKSGFIDGESNQSEHNNSNYFDGKTPKIFEGETRNAESNSKLSDRILSEIDEENKSEKLEELRKEITEQYEKSTGEKLELSEEQLLSILDAHEQDGELGKLTIGQLRVKVKILSEAITDPKVRRFLLEAGFCGKIRNTSTLQQNSNEGDNEISYNETPTNHNTSNNGTEESQNNKNEGLLINEEDNTLNATNNPDYTENVNQFEELLEKNAAQMKLDTMFNEKISLENSGLTEYQINELFKNFERIKEITGNEKLSEGDTKQLSEIKNLNNILDKLLNPDIKEKIKEITGNEKLSIFDIKTLSKIENLDIILDKLLNPSIKEKIKEITGEEKLSGRDIKTLSEIGNLDSLLDKLLNPSIKEKIKEITGNEKLSVGNIETLSEIENLDIILNRLSNPDIKEKIKEITGEEKLFVYGINILSNIKDLKDRLDTITPNIKAKYEQLSGSNLSDITLLGDLLNANINENILDNLISIKEKYGYHFMTLGRQLTIIRNFTEADFIKISKMMTKDPQKPADPRAQLIRYFGFSGDVKNLEFINEKIIKVENFNGKFSYFIFNNGDDISLEYIGNKTFIFHASMANEYAAGRAFEDLVNTIPEGYKISENTSLSGDSFQLFLSEFQRKFRSNYIVRATGKMIYLNSQGKKKHLSKTIEDKCVIKDAEIFEAETQADAQEVADEVNKLMKDRGQPLNEGQSINKLAEARVVQNKETGLWRVEVPQIEMVKEYNNGAELAQQLNKCKAYEEIINILERNLTTEYHFRDGNLTGQQLLDRLDAYRNKRDLPNDADDNPLQFIPAEFIIPARTINEERMPTGRKSNIQKLLDS